MFKNFLLANPDLMFAIKDKAPFEHCKAVEKAYVEAKYTKAPFVLSTLAQEGELAYLNKGQIFEAIIDIEKVPPLAFAGASNLKKLTLGPKVKVIGSGAFINCVNLSSIILPENLEKIEYNAFSGCSMLKGSVRVPDSLKEIQTNAFEDTHIKLAVNKERTEKLKVDIKDAEWYKTHMKGILVR